MSGLLSITSVQICLNNFISQQMENFTVEYLFELVLCLRVQYKFYIIQGLPKIKCQTSGNDKKCKKIDNRSLHFPQCVCL